MTLFLTPHKNKTDYLRTIEFDKPREAAKVMINQLRTRNFMLCFLGADYYYAFARPTTELNNSFRLEREVLVLLNKYPSFDAAFFSLVLRPAAPNLNPTLLLWSHNRVNDFPNDW